jgi:PAX-interacting protein 1
VDIFKGITATISQLSAKDVKKLWTIFEMYGGKLKPSLDVNCTHLICGKGVGVSKLSTVRNISVNQLS